VCDPGFLGISADFKGCEIFVAAALSGDRGLLEAETSAKCYKCGEFAYDDEEWQPCSCGFEIKNGQRVLNSHTGLHWMAAHSAFGKGATKEHRYWCKRIIFSKLFGGSAKAGARQVGIDIEESQVIHSAFEELAPVYSGWDKWLRQCFYDGSMVWRDYSTGTNFSMPIDGARRGIYRTYNGRNIYVSNGAHKFSNYAIQGTARELLVEGIIKWSETEWGQYPLLPIHDEVLSWVPAGEAKQAAQKLKECMATRVLSVPGWDVLVDADTDDPFSYWPDSSLVADTCKLVRCPDLSDRKKFD
jgi:DNA polymerase I-like protein with 3'-5' exonuclease and polymerase domains